MTSKQYLMRRSCDLPVPPPFNETPFQYECLPTNMVRNPLHGSCDGEGPDVPILMLQVHKDTAEKMNEDLFCGWKEGRLWLDCPAEPVINAYLNAYDFKVSLLPCLLSPRVSPLHPPSRPRGDQQDTTRNHLDVDVSFNATGYLRGGGQGPGRNHRTQEAMNVVTNAFLKYVLGSNEFSAAIRAIKVWRTKSSPFPLGFLRSSLSP